MTDYCPKSLHLSAVKSSDFIGEFKFLPLFYRAMHFSAKRGIAIACRLSVCL